MQENENWTNILEFARWAPSPHNVQPWKLKILDDTRAELFYDAARLLPVEDANGMFLTVGFGIFLEALDVAASPLGFKVNAQFGDPINTTTIGVQHFAFLELVPLSPNDPLSRDLLLERGTARSDYLNRPIDPTLVRELKEIARQHNEIFEVSSDPNLVKWMLDLNCETMFYDMEDDETRKEVGLWIRYTRGEAMKKGDGLWVYCLMGSALITKIFFNARWIINLPVVRNIARRSYVRQMKGTNTIAWLSGALNTQVEQVTAGRMLLRMWLTMTKYGVGLHPFGSIITNPKAHKQLCDKIMVDESERMLWLVMRMGYAAEVPRRSCRKTLDEIILK